MNIREVADDCVTMSKAGHSDQIGEKYWADNIVSIEAMEGPMARLEGIEAVRGKSAWWDANHSIDKLETYGPYVNGDQFAIRWVMDVTHKPDGKPMHMEEVALYTVADGKIVEERFFAGS